VVVEIIRVIIMMEQKSPERTTTGIEGLDAAFNGGIPIPSLVLLLGDVGTGKSVICQQFVYIQAELGFRSVYFCIDHQPEDIKENMRSLGWDVKRYESSGVLRFIDMFSSEDYTFEGLKEVVEREIRSCERFVFDSISSVAFVHGERRAYELLQKMKKTARANSAVGIINAVRGMHSRSFEVAIQQVCCNVISLRMKKDGRYLKIVKTMKTGHTTEEFGIEIERRVGVNLI